MARSAGCAALGLLLLGVAAFFGTPALYVPGVGLVLLGVGAVAWVRLAARGARVERELSGGRVMEGAPLPVVVRTAAGGLPLPSCEVEDALLADPLPVPGGAGATLELEARFERRGVVDAPPPRLRLRDPLGLVEASVVGTEGARVLVLPRIEPVLADGAGALLREGETASASPGAAAIEMDGLRPHEEGRPASRLHWPTVARTGELIERRLLPESDSRPLVVLDASTPASEEDLDSAVRAAASLCHHLARAGGAAALVGRARRPIVVTADLQAWPELHTRLALVGPSRAAPAVTGAAARTAALFWVCAWDGPPPARLRGRRSYLVRPAGLGGADEARPAFEVAGCRGWPLRRLSAASRTDQRTAA